MIQQTQARDEIEDLSQEFERERETYLETIRQANSELKLWEQVAALILPKTTINKIQEKAVWDEDLDEWRLPRIDFKATDPMSAKLPTIGGKGGSSSGKVLDQLSYMSCMSVPSYLPLFLPTYTAATNPGNRERPSIDMGEDPDANHDDYGPQRKGSRTPQRTPKREGSGSTMTGGLESIDPRSRQNSAASSNRSRDGGGGAGGERKRGTVEDMFNDAEDAFSITSGGGGGRDHPLPVREWGSSSYSMSSSIERGLMGEGSSTSAALREARCTEDKLNNSRQGGGADRVKLSGTGWGVLEHIDPLQMSKRMSQPQATTEALLLNNTFEEMERRGSTSVGANKLKALGPISSSSDRGSAGKLLGK